MHLSCIVAQNGHSRIFLLNSVSLRSFEQFNRLLQCSLILSALGSSKTTTYLFLIFRYSEAPCFRARVFHLAYSDFQNLRVSSVRVVHSEPTFFFFFHFQLRYCVINFIFIRSSFCKTRSYLAMLYV